MAFLTGNFGVDDGQPYVLVEAGRSTVLFSEIRQTRGPEMVKLLRAELSRETWDVIAPHAGYTLNQSIEEFNKNSRTSPTPHARFKKYGETRLDICNLGKELLCLVFAVETARPEELETIATAWRHLHMVERWWLYNQAVAWNGPLHGKGQGWRLAIYHALAAKPTGAEEELPVTPAPEKKTKAAAPLGFADFQAAVGVK